MSTSPILLSIVPAKPVDRKKLILKSMEIIMEPKYTKGTTADQIIHDGWSRSLKLEQTVNELIAQGYEVSVGYIVYKWAEYELDMTIAISGGFGEDPIIY